MKNKVGSKTFAILIYMLLFILTLVGIQQIWSSDLFDKINFLNWDANHYNFIKEKGYQDFRLAFLPADSMRNIQTKSALTNRAFL